MANATTRRPQETATVIPFRRFGAPVNGIHHGNRVLLRLVEDAEQQITTVERRGKTAEQIYGVPPIDPEMLASVNGGDAWDRDGGVALHPPYSRPEKLWMVGTLALVAWIAAYFLWQFAGRPWL
jgi:hypothetical protein